MQMENILHDLYFGRILGYDRHPDGTDEINRINEKILIERKYFEDKMTDEDAQRFQALESLYTQTVEFSEIDTFIYGFKLGAKLMCSVFAEEMDSSANS